MVGFSAGATITTAQLGNNTTTTGEGSRQQLPASADRPLFRVLPALRPVNTTLAPSAPIGGAWCWGLNNNYGQVGNNTTTTEKTPVAVSGTGNTAGLTNVLSMGAGATHTCSVSGAREMFFVGARDNDGQLGNNSTTTQHAPIEVLRRQRLRISIRDLKTRHSDVKTSDVDTHVNETGLQIPRVKDRTTWCPRTPRPGTRQNYETKPVLGLFTSGTSTGESRLILYSKANVKSFARRDSEVLLFSQPIESIFCYPQPFHTGVWFLLRLRTLTGNGLATGHGDRAITPVPFMLHALHSISRAF